MSKRTPSTYKPSEGKESKRNVKSIVKRENTISSLVMFVLSIKPKTPGTKQPNRIQGVICVDTTNTRLLKESKYNGYINIPDRKTGACVKSIKNFSVVSMGIFDDVNIEPLNFYSLYNIYCKDSEKTKISYINLEHIGPCEMPHKSFPFYLTMAANEEDDIIEFRQCEDYCKENLDSSLNVSKIEDFESTSDLYTSQKTTIRLTQPGAPPISELIRIREQQDIESTQHSTGSAIADESHTEQSSSMHFSETENSADQSLVTQTNEEQSILNRPLQIVGENELKLMTIRELHKSNGCNPATGSRIYDAFKYLEDSAIYYPTAKCDLRNYLETTYVGLNTYPKELQDLIIMDSIDCEVRLLYSADYTKPSRKTNLIPSPMISVADSIPHIKIDLSFEMSNGIEMIIDISMFKSAFKGCGFRDIRELQKFIVTYRMPYCYMKLSFNPSRTQSIQEYLDEGKPFQCSATTGAVLWDMYNYVNTYGYVVSDEITIARLICMYILDFTKSNFDGTSITTVDEKNKNSVFKTCGRPIDLARLVESVRRGDKILLCGDNYGDGDLWERKVLIKEGKIGTRWINIGGSGDNIANVFRYWMNSDRDRCNIYMMTAAQNGTSRASDMPESVLQLLANTTIDPRNMYSCHLFMLETDLI